MEKPLRENPSNKPIGVLAALAGGFERVAAKPYLILPSLLLDLLLWLGPRLSVSSLVPESFMSLWVSASIDPDVTEQLMILQSMIENLIERFNVMGALSVLPAGMPFNLFIASGSLPAGVPSLMAGRLPMVSPQGSPLVVMFRSPGSAIATWIGLTVIGLGFGVFYHRLLVRHTTPQVQMDSALTTWLRMILLYLLAYIGGIMVMAIAMLGAFAVGFFVPLLGTGVLFVGLSLLFWAAIYFAFTVHGIVRNQFSVIKSMKESALIVRSNPLSTMGLLFLSFGVIWFSVVNIWNLPDEGSWYNLLSLVGYAFVSTTLIAASYVFYDGRRMWLEKVRLALLDQIPDGKGPSGPGVSS